MTDISIPPVQVSPASAGELSAAMLDSLAKTRPWVKFLAILGFVMVGILVLVSLGMAGYGIWLFMDGKREGAMVAGIGVLYLVMGVVYIFPSRYLWRYASSIGEAIEAPSKTHAVEAALSHQKSFWKFVGIVSLISILLYIPGVIAAIAIPNVLTAMQRSKQKRTVAHIRTIAAAIEARASDTNEYPVASLDELATMLEPKYVESFPRTDGWGNRFVYQGIDCSGQRCLSYVLASAGKDGRVEQEPLIWFRTEPSAIKTFNDDIVYSNGEFLRYPEGFRAD
ncbi:MAG: type II secretion system protein GspG [Thermoanaerobaculia bacterium]